MAKTHKRLRTKRQREHGSEFSAGHREDKAAGDTRRKAVWLFVGERSDELGHERDFQQVHGMDLIPAEHGTLAPVSSTEFVSFLELQNKELDHYYGDKKRGKKITQTRIKYKDPIIETTVTFSPWVSDGFEIECEVNPVNAKKLLHSWAMETAREFEQKTGRKIIAVTIHLDTDDPHINLFHSRIQKDQNGINRLTGDKHLGLLGPWCVGVWRQRKVGIKNESNERKLLSSIEKYNTRPNGGNIPLDIHLADYLDSLADKEFGHELEVLKADYRKRTEVKQDSFLLRMRQGLMERIEQIDKLLQPVIAKTKTINKGIQNK